MRTSINHNLRDHVNANVQCFLQDLVRVPQVLRAHLKCQELEAVATSEALIRRWPIRISLYSREELIVKNSVSRNEKLLETI